MTNDLPAIERLAALPDNMLDVDLAELSQEYPHSAADDVITDTYVEFGRAVLQMVRDDLKPILADLRAELRIEPLHHPDCPSKPYEEADVVPEDVSCTCTDLAQRWKARAVIARAEKRALLRQSSEWEGLALERWQVIQETEAQIQRLREALDSLRWRHVLCGNCGHRYRLCAGCSSGIKYAGPVHTGCTHQEQSCPDSCLVARALLKERG